MDNSFSAVGNFGHRCVHYACHSKKETVLSWPLFAIAVVFYTLSQSANFKDSEGWKNKYKQPMTPAPDNWYYKFFRLKYREKFPLSGSFLVSLTDKYHFYQLGFKAFLCLSIALHRPTFDWWIETIGYFAAFGIVFTLIYRRK